MESLCQDRVTGGMTKSDHSTGLCLLCCKVGDELTLAGETEAPPRLGCQHSVKKLQINVNTQVSWVPQLLDLPHGESP